jgi:hypothetical protein
MNIYKAERLTHTKAEIMNLLHLKESVPFIVAVKVLLFKGFMRSRKVNNPIIKGNNNISRFKFGSYPRGLRSFGFSDKMLIISGSAMVFNPIAISRGIAPMVLVAVKIAISIIR